METPSAGGADSGVLPSGARWRAYGKGTPVTLVAHGLGATEGEARIPASGLPGTRVVVTLPSHGSAAAAPDGYWQYGRIAADLLNIADHVGARNAAGVSLGAGALTCLAAQNPTRFDRLALLLPASLDYPRDMPACWALEQLAEAVEAAPADGGDSLRRLVSAEVPEGAEVGDYVDRRSAALTRLGDALRALPVQSAVSDAASLRKVTSKVLVVAATDDPLHPAEVGKLTAAAFPNSQLELLSSSAPLLTHRAEVRRMLIGFLC